MKYNLTEVKGQRITNFIKIVGIFAQIILMLIFLDYAFEMAISGWQNPN